MALLFGNRLKQETIRLPAKNNRGEGLSLETLPLVQRRTLAVLASAQIIGTAGLAAGGTTGALIGRDLLGGTTFAGLAPAFLVFGTTATAVPLSRYMARAGRRPGLQLGWFLGGIGAAAVVAAAVWSIPVLLLAGMALVGSAAAASDAAKYAAADLTLPAGRGIAIGGVVAASTVSAIVGPNLASPSGDVARTLGVPELAGPFLLAALAFVVASLVLALFLRPDPLMVARRFAQPASPGLNSASQMHISLVLRRPGVGLALIAMAVANFVMILVMTMVPIHISEHHEGLNIVGLAVSAHVAGMYALSPLTGWLSDRLGRVPVISLGGCWLLLAGTLIATVGSHNTTMLIAGVVVLGIGWNFGLIGGSALLTDAAPETDRPRIQGIADATAGIAGILASVLSGLLLSAAGFAVIGLVAAGVAVGLLGVSLPRHGKLTTVSTSEGTS